MIDNDKEVSSMKEKDIQRETSQIVKDVLEKANLKQGSIFVLGLSSSEVIGGQIGRNPAKKLGKSLWRPSLDILEENGIHLAVQGCEHVNRALVVERQVAEQFGLEIVSVLPTLHAGGSGQLAAFKFMQDPVEVEFIKAHAGLDIRGHCNWHACQACSGSDSPSFERNWACPCNGSC